MDYFSKFLRSGTQLAPKPPQDHALELHKSWTLVKNTLLYPDERQLTRGIKSTDVPAHLQSMVDSLVWESTRTEEGATGACLEYLLKNDVLGTLVKLSESDRPFGIQAEVLRAVQNMVVLLDEQFLVHSAVHKAVLRLLRNCAGDDLQEQLDNRNKVMGAAKDAVRSSPSEYEEDLVNLLCILCSRIRTYRELLMIFFHDKHWYRSEPLFSVEEEDEEEDEDGDEDEKTLGDSAAVESSKPNRSISPSLSQGTITSAPESSVTKKPEYEFLLFNYLLRFVHREGQIGDFARAGLLFLMDVAMSPGEPAHRIGGDEAQTPTATSSADTHQDPIADAALALAEYIVDGDFSDVLGAGLSAVYSVLPTKLEIRPPPPSDAALGNGMLIGSIGPLSEEDKEKEEAERDKRAAMGVEDSSNPDFKARLDHFLKLLEFLQDVIRRNVVHESDDTSLDASGLMGTAIVRSILDAVQRTFLENVLYPSILECSDADGSAVAVMSYIETMIRDLGEGEISDLLVNFLASEDNDELPRTRPRHRSTLDLDKTPIKKPTQKTTKAERRKSSAMMLLEMEAPDSKKQSEYFTSMGRFTLKDLILTNLRSKSQTTGTVALQLLRSMLLQHCHVSVERLLVVFPDPMATTYPIPALLPSTLDIKSPSGLADIEEDDDDEIFMYPGAAPPASFEYSTAFPQPQTTYSTHEREMGLYLTLVSRVDPSHNGDAFSTGYDHYLRDALIAIQSHSCFTADVDAEARSKFKHKLNPNDRILSLILESLRKFFANSPEYNMALTGVLATLAVCPDRSLAGWLTFASSDGERTPPADTEANVMWGKDDGDDRSIDFRIEERLEADSHPLPASILDENSRPVVHTIFHGLVSQLERYRLLVDDFDKYLFERRQGLLFSENLTDALTLALDLDNNITSSTSRSGSLQAPETPPKPKSKPSKSSSLVSFLTPRKSRSKAQDPTTPPRKAEKLVPPSPFASHYKETNSVNVEPFAVAPPSFGPWQPGEAKRWQTDDDDVFTSSNAWGDKDDNPFLDREAKDDGHETPRTITITLSQLLDNVVILEESIKELAAIIHARRSLGIDAIRYL